MENTSVSMEQIQQMLVGSQRLNQMRSEIDATIRMALGFLTKAEVSRFRYGVVICQFTTPGLNWKITKWKREAVGVDAYTNNSDEQVVYGFVSGNKWATPEVGMKFVQLVHQALPDVLTNLVMIFPSLVGRFAPLLQAASK